MQELLRTPVICVQSADIADTPIAKILKHMRRTGAPGSALAMHENRSAFVLN